MCQTHTSSYIRYLLHVCVCVGCKHTRVLRPHRLGSLPSTPSAGTTPPPPRKVLLSSWFPSSKRGRHSEVTLLRHLYFHRKHLSTLARRFKRNPVWTTNFSLSLSQQSFHPVSPLRVVPTEGQSFGVWLGAHAMVSFPGSLLSLNVCMLMTSSVLTMTGGWGFCLRRRWHFRETRSSSIMALQNDRCRWWGRERRS